MKGIFPFLAFVVVQPLLLSNNNKKRNAVLKTNLDSLCIQLDKCAAVHFVGLNVLVYPHSRILNFQNQNCSVPHVVVCTALETGEDKTS